MIINYVLMFLIAMSTISHAMETAPQDVQLTEVAVVPSTIATESDDTVVARPITKCERRCGLLAISTLAMLVIVALPGSLIYDAAHPQLKCASLDDNEIPAEQLNQTNVEGHSFDLVVRNCGPCSKYSRACNGPIDGIENAAQLHAHIKETLDPLCGTEATYGIKINVKPENPFHFYPRTEQFGDFANQKAKIREICKISDSNNKKDRLRSFSKPQKHKKSFR